MLKLTLFLILTAVGITSAAPPATAQTIAGGIKMSFGGQEVIVEMYGNPASRDFMSLLPFSGEFEDFAGAEKISRLPRKLSTHRSPTPRQAQGDFAYYAPWGNLAVFYKGFGSDGNLYVLGRIVSGKELLSNIRQKFAATIEKAE